MKSLTKLWITILLFAVLIPTLPFTMQLGPTVFYTHIVINLVVFSTIIFSIILRKKE